MKKAAKSLLLVSAIFDVVSAVLNALLAIIGAVLFVGSIVYGVMLINAYGFDTITQYAPEYIYYLVIFGVLGISLLLAGSISFIGFAASGVIEFIGAGKKKESKKKAIICSAVGLGIHFLLTGLFSNLFVIVALILSIASKKDLWVVEEPIPGELPVEEIPEVAPEAVVEEAQVEEIPEAVTEEVKEEEAPKAKKAPAKKKASSKKKSAK